MGCGPFGPLASRASSRYLPNHHRSGRASGHNVIWQGLALAPAPFHWGLPARPPTRRKGTGTVAEIRLEEGDSVERALKTFRRKVQKEGLFSELRRRRHYLKPSAARVLKAQLARRRKRRKLAAALAG